MNIGDSLLINAEKYPQKVAIVVGDESKTYKVLNSIVNQLANRLLEIGLKKGDLIAILSENSVPWVEALYAIFKIGAVAVPINYRLLHSEIINELRRNDVAALFFTADYLEVAKSYKGSRGKETPLILLEGKGYEEIPSLDTFISESADLEPSVEVNGSDTGLILFTGGTTGLPKGAICTHDMLIWTSINYMVEYETPRTDHIMLHPFPIFHTSGMFRVLSYMRSGATYITMKIYDTEKCLKLIEKYRVSSFIGSSAVFVPMLELKKNHSFDTSSVAICCATFAYMDKEGKKRLKELFPNAKIYEAYGSTEGGTISCLRPDQTPKETGSVGRPSVHTRMKIVDDQGNVLPYGQVGEIVIKGPHVAIGYYNNPEETKAAFQDEWFFTGDMGKLDEGGFLYLADRKKDMIKTGGENVYSREVEEVLFSHPNIKEAAVIGVPHKRWGETIKAVIVKEKGAELREEEVIEFCKQHMASYKKPTSVVFVDSIPKTKTGGKIAKWKLREKYGKLD